METILNNSSLFGDEAYHFIRELPRNTFLTYFFLIFSFLGKELFLMFLIPGIYWFKEKYLISRAALLLFISTYFTLYLKSFYQSPRPQIQFTDLIEVGPFLSSLLPHFTENTMGFPSGHAVAAVVFYFFLFLKLKNKINKLICFLCFLFIPLSRLYLGLHFPGDIIGGLLLGFITLGCFYIFPSFEEIHKAISRYFWFWALSLILITLFLSIFLFPDENIYSRKNIASLLGLNCSYVIFLFKTSDNRDFNPSTGWVKLFIKIAIGIFLYLILQSGIKYLFIKLNPSGNIMSLYYIRYFFLGMVLVYIFPKFCIRFGLNGQPASSR
jgi:membrane-associated phospholipid phosphatase